MLLYFMAQGAPEAELAGGVVIYDAECSFCVAQVRRLRALAGKRFRFDPLQWHDESTIGIPQADLRRELKLVLRTGEVYGGMDAIVRVVASGRRWQNVALRLYRLPGIRPLANRLYRLTARYRYHISRFLGDDLCSSGSCGLGS